MRKRKKNKKSLSFIIIVILLLCYNYFGEDIEKYILNKTSNYNVYDISDIPSYSGKEYIVINNNEPFFTEDDKNLNTFETYGKLDSLKRCTYAYANIDISLLPTLERTSIGNIKPTGWHTVKYDNIDGKYLYNRCHLIGYQLTGENDNKNNLITCTRQMNVGIMLTYENMVKDYIESTKNNVLYRVTPLFRDSNLLADGVLMEGYSVNDNGKGIKFNIFVYNVQDGIVIDYKTGDSYKK